MSPANSDLASNGRRLISLVRAGGFFGVMLIGASSLLYCAKEPTAMSSLGSAIKVDKIAYGIAAVGIIFILINLGLTLRVVGLKLGTQRTITQAETRSRWAKSVVYDLPSDRGDIVLELFEFKPGGQHAQISLIDAVRRAYKESRTSAAASFATAFGNGPDDIITMYATFFAEHIPIYGCKPPSAAVEQILLTDPLKEFQIEDGALTLKERQGTAIYADLHIKTSDYAIVLARLCTKS